MLHKQLLLLCLLLLIGWAKQIDAEQFFKELKALNQKNYPDFFKVKLESSVLELQKKTFPPEMIEFNQEPTLYMLFKKSRSPILTLEGVLEYYKNYFTPYESIIENTGIFLGVDSYDSYKKFSDEYLIRVDTQSTGGYKFSVREREGLKGDYGEYFFNNEKKLIRINFYQDDKLHGHTLVFYKKLNDHTDKQVPSKMIVRYEKPEIGGLKEFSISFLEYDTDPSLGKDFFLD